jgi:hypothetical protein
MGVAEKLWGIRVVEIVGKDKYNKYFVQPAPSAPSTESDTSDSAANGRFVAVIEASCETPATPARGPGTLDEGFGDVGAVLPHNATVVVRGGHGAGH